MFEFDIDEVKALVQGVGFNDGKYLACETGVKTKEYSLWSSMLGRCTPKYWITHPTYVGTTHSENFKSYTFFHEWCQEQKGFKSIDENNRYWQLDKDLLLRGNKHYSEDTCVFVPQRLNKLLIKSNASRGEFPIGVSWYNPTKKFTSRCQDIYGKSKLLGYFNTPQEAFQAYKTFKEALIKEVANEYKEMLDSRVYEALINYEVNEND